MSRVVPGAEILDALRLEDIEFTKSIRDGVGEAETEIRSLTAKMAAQGLLNSGPRHVREMEIRFNNLATCVIDKAIGKRRELGRRVPELFTPTLLSNLKSKLDQHIDGLMTGNRTRVELFGSPLGAEVVSALHQRWQEKAIQLRAKVEQDIEILRLEARLGLHEEKPMTLNISNNTIANLNLGTVVGDLNASVQILNSRGEKGLATAIQALAETLAASADLPEANRKELLEHLSVISSESTLPPEKRKIGPLRASIACLREGVADVAKLSALWPPIEQILKSMGIMS